MRWCSSVGSWMLDTHHCRGRETVYHRVKRYTDVLCVACWSTVPLCAAVLLLLLLEQSNETSKTPRKCYNKGEYKDPGKT